MWVLSIAITFLIFYSYIYRWMVLFDAICVCFQKHWYYSHHYISFVTRMYVSKLLILRTSSLHCILDLRIIMQQVGTYANYWADRTRFILNTYNAILLTSLKAKLSFILKLRILPTTCNIFMVHNKFYVVLLYFCENTLMSCIYLVCALLV